MPREQATTVVLDKVWMRTARSMPQATSTCPLAGKYAIAAAASRSRYGSGSSSSEPIDTSGRPGPEIVIEGSMDGVEWREYRFRYTPGDVRKPPRFVAPHQPRLDINEWHPGKKEHHQKEHASKKAAVKH